MATLLRFEPAPRSAAPRGGALKGPADILFFTGIRYERHTSHTSHTLAEKPAAKGETIAPRPRKLKRGRRSALAVKPGGDPA
ncbi:hypothetical protein [Pseudohoeflea coraliihabitans]|uniref:Uncharacterized protein n=1 Tax=Pseudohoeflea coraliihabitans TaxID=2860393 RepID=A0ABS6WRQ6_9HYPH|nr:hypothetical protein [Pseudohoeflea sp. DP4N28-3]MBW3098648.1 hypothetical protein [Pseudohoeflea sp. DP4N28-3]